MKFCENKMFQPLQIGSMVLKNRVGLAPMTLGSEDPKGLVSQGQLDFYKTRAAGGAGYIEMDAVTIDRAIPYRGPTTCLDSDEYIAPMKEVTDAVHAYGCKLIPQIVHAGPESFIGFQHKNPPASSVYMNAMGHMTRAISLEEIPPIIEKFGAAAKRAKAAGFDGVQIHCGHGYMLLGSFLSPLRNHRTDAYGGSLDNRARLTLEVLREVRKQVGPEFPIMLRVSGSERHEGSNTLEDMLYLAPKFVEAGASAFEVSGGVNYEEPWNIIPCHGCPQGINVPEAEAIKKVVNVPVMVVGKINDIRYGADLIERGVVDGVVMGRPFFAEPELVNKAMEERFDDIAPCASCGGCVSPDPVDGYDGPHCHINPRLFHELDYPMVPTEGKKKKVLIIGGGIGGMEAAYTAAVRGHDVTLWEASKDLGGHLALACIPPTKQDIAKWMVYLRGQMNKLGVKVEFEKEATVEAVKAFAPEAVIIATGAKAAVPPIPGTKDYPIVTSYEFLEGKLPIKGGKICVLGGGIVACEVVETIFQRAFLDTEVTIVEMLPQILGDYARYNRELLLRSMKSNNLTIMTSTKVVEYQDHQITVQLPDGTQKVLDGFDHIIFALGARGYDPLSEELKTCIPEVFVIGEAKKAPRMAVKAVSEAFDIAYHL
ncbi:MAG: NAD(P)/FAD-dependent oxidoreductase [Oscillospiraceae bacterium]